MRLQNLIKRMSCFVLIAALILSLGSFAMADSTSLSSDAEEYIATVIPRYLSIEGSHYNDVSISNGFKVNGNENPNARTFYIFSGDETVGVLNLTQRGGEFYSTFYFENNSTVDGAYKTGRRIALSSSQIEGCHDLIVSLESEYKTFSLNNSNLEYSSIELTPVTSYIVSQPNLNSVLGVIGDSDSPYYVNLYSFPYVSSTIIKDVGICWAACVAAIANYRMGTNYTAESLYYALDDLYSGTPEGTKKWYERGYALSGMSATVTSSLQWQTLYSLLSSGKPVIFRMTDGKLFPTKHAIVLKLFSGGNDYTTYGFMDPNYSSTRTVYMTGSLDPDTFVYTSGSYEYSWYGSVY